MAGSAARTRAAALSHEPRYNSDPATLKNIEDSGKLVFHSVGDTGGVSTPTYIDGVSRFMEYDVNYIAPPTGHHFSITWETLFITTEKVRIIGLSFTIPISIPRPDRRHSWKP